MAMSQIQPSSRQTALSDPELRRSLLRFVERRLKEHDAEDVVQATLTEALAAREAPEAPEELRRWVFGIAKNKIVDVYRRTKREAPPESGLSDEAATAESAPLSARDLLRWAEKEMPEGADSTLEWMLREGAGEKLEHIAAEEALPPARVRQRVSRMRRHYRSRWAAQLAAVAAISAIALAIWAIWRGRATPGPEDIAQEKTPLERGKEIRRDALEHCDKAEWTPCIEGLDRAKALDPAGDTAERVQRARDAAKEPKKIPPPEPTPSPTPSSSAPIRTAPPVNTDAPMPQETKDIGPKPPVKTLPKPKAKSAPKWSGSSEPDKGGAK